MADTQSLREMVHARIPFSAWLGVVMLFILFGIIVLAVIGPSPRGTSYEQTRAKAREDKLQELRKQDAAALTSYGWIDKNKGLTRIPIERAMELTMAELAQKKPAAAGPIAAPEAQPPAAATGVATPPAAQATASPQASATPKVRSVTGPESEIRGQPTGAANPPGVAPGTQPGAAASPAASGSPPSGKPAASPPPNNPPKPPGTPLPVRGQTPGQM